MTLNERIEAFSRLGNILIDKDNYQNNNSFPHLSDVLKKWENCINNEYIYNSWFIPEFIQEAIKGIIFMLNKDKLQQWTALYPDLKNKTTSNRIGVIMAGNIPMVGFHDFLCVLLAGDVFIGKLSSNDKHLLPLLAEILCVIEPRFKKSIVFTEGKIQSIDKIIATGSNNSMRYFDFYFSKYPSILRSHCNSIAILNGNENKSDLQALSNDISLYFGLGCRSISKLYVPHGYDFTPLFTHLNRFKPIFEMHNAYMNNLEYQKTVHLINRIPFLDQGIWLFKEHTSLASPISIVHYEYYDKPHRIYENLAAQSEELQCKVCYTVKDNDCIGFGQAQYPDLWDYANKKDTIAFLLENKQSL